MKARSFSWQFTDNKADSDPGLDDVAQASGPGEGGLASVVVGVLSERATFQG